MLNTKSNDKFKRDISSVSLPKEEVVHDLSLRATVGALPGRKCTYALWDRLIDLDYLSMSSFSVTDFDRHFNSWQDQRVELAYKKITNNSLSIEEKILLDTLNKRLNKNSSTQLPSFLQKADDASDFIEAFLSKK